MKVSFERDNFLAYLYFICQGSIGTLAGSKIDSSTFYSRENTVDVLYMLDICTMAKAQGPNVKNGLDASQNSQNKAVNLAG